MNATSPLFTFGDVLPSTLGRSHDYTLLVAPFLVIVFVLYISSRRILSQDNIPTVNRTFFLEPGIFARFRWAFHSISILDNAYEKYKGRTYRLARGDADILVLPPELIDELNKLPHSTINSRRSYTVSLTGNLNGLDVVLKTTRHVKLLLARVTPSIPDILPTIRTRVEESIIELFPQGTESWQPVEPVNAVVHCISQAIALATFGPPICDDPVLIRLYYEHTLNMFSIILAMRMVPQFLQPMLVWLLPQKWRLERGWKTLNKFIVSAVENRENDENAATKPDLLSGLILDNKGRKPDIHELTRLIGSTIAGGTYSIAAFVVGVIADLNAHPGFLDEIRQEIRATNKMVGGHWDQTAFNSLDKLESAMKETSRLSPGSLLVYSRCVESDIVLSNGLKLNQGQLVTVSGHSKSMDPTLVENPTEYDAFRAYNDLDRHRAQPFRGVEGDDYRWGAGRWACPGRFLASLVAKVLLVKLLNEYDFSFVGGQRPKTSILHEFVYIDPSIKMLVRRRPVHSGIEY